MKTAGALVDDFLELIRDVTGETVSLSPEGEAAMIALAHAVNALRSIR